MILGLIKGLLYLLLSLILAGFVKDLHCYLYWRLKYKNQGIKFEYIPILGMIYYVVVGLHPLFEKKGSLKHLMPEFFTESDPVAKFS